MILYRTTLFGDDVDAMGCLLHLHTNCASFAREIDALNELIAVLPEGYIQDIGIVVETTCAGGYSACGLLGSEFGFASELGLLAAFSASRFEEGLEAAISSDIEQLQRARVLAVLAVPVCRRVFKYFALLGGSNNNASKSLESAIGRTPFGLSRFAAGGYVDCTTCKLTVCSRRGMGGVLHEDMRARGNEYSGKG